jgi:hypothetical protein
MDIPPTFNADFLLWFKSRTEDAWAHYHTIDFTSTHRAGTDWMEGTRWLLGLTEDEVDAIERTWSITFPPDYRLFLRQLHAVNKPMKKASFRNGGIVVEERPAFYNWLTDKEEIARLLAWPVDGLLYDVQHNDLWLPDWGARPANHSTRHDVVRKLANAAPRLIPVFAHRFLVDGTTSGGSSVLSIWQSDIVLYGRSLREYFLREFASLLGLNDRHKVTDTPQDRAMSRRVLESIPLWGDLALHRIESK